MPSPRIPKNRTHGVYFLTIAIREFRNILPYHNRWEILADTLSYFQMQPTFRLFSFVFMPNHIHLIVLSEDTIAFLHAFKRHTASMIKKNILNCEPRLLPLFVNARGFSLWEKTNMPKYIETEAFMRQKITYIHMNPVRKLLVKMPEDWWWSSANIHCPLKVSAWGGI